LFFNYLQYLFILHYFILVFDIFIHNRKILFFFVGSICNLAVEFNGLVSTKGRQQC